MKVHYPTLEDSLRCLLDQRLTRELARETAHRIAGNVQRLRERRPVPPWVAQHDHEWVPVQVLAARPLRQERSRKMGSVLTMKILAGTPCPLTVTEWWSLRRCRLFSKDFGFSSQRNRESAASRRPFSAPEQLVQMRMYRLVDPALSREVPALTDVAFVDSMRDWNRAVLRRRFREGFDCPLGMPRSFSCHRCHLGYAAENKRSCPAATHRLTYRRRVCEGCGESAYHDKEIPYRGCVNCYLAEQYKPL